MLIKTFKVEYKIVIQYLSFSTVLISVNEGQVFTTTDKMM